MWPDDTTPALLESGDFLRLYAYVMGRSEVPTAYNIWCGLAVLAATVADRVWLQKFAGKKLPPNLYTILLGPSGVGKGEAISLAAALTDPFPRINTYAGEITASELIHYLGTPQKAPDGTLVLENAKVFLITEELGMSVGKQQEAETFIKHLTGMYKADTYTFRKGTRTGGQVVLRDHCINWLAGTTAKWLIDTVPAEVIEGGFLGRLVVIQAEYDFNLRVTRPEYPPDRAQVVDYLLARVEALSYYTDEVVMTPAARELEDQWYQNRPVPDDEALLPSWRRQHDMILKIGTLLALARDDRDPLFDRAEWNLARHLSSVAHRALPNIQRLIQTNASMACYEWTKNFIQQRKRVPHFVLSRRAAARGYVGQDLKDALERLRVERYVRIEHTEPQRGPAGRIYVWARGVAPTNKGGPK